MMRAFAHPTCTAAAPDHNPGLKHNPNCSLQTAPAPALALEPASPTRNPPHNPVPTPARTSTATAAPNHRPNAHPAPSPVGLCAAASLPREQLCRLPPRRLPPRSHLPPRWPSNTRRPPPRQRHYRRRWPRRRYGRRWPRRRQWRWRRRRRWRWRWRWRWRRDATEATQQAGRRRQARRQARRRRSGAPSHDSGGRCGCGAAEGRRGHGK